jgi:hypothetical protein
MTAAEFGEFIAAGFGGGQGYSGSKHQAEVSTSFSGSG